MKAVRPKLELVKTIEEAAMAVDEMFSSAFQTTAGMVFFLGLDGTAIHWLLKPISVSGEESGDDDSGDEDERREGDTRDDEEEEDLGSQDSPVSNNAHVKDVSWPLGPKDWRTCAIAWSRSGPFCKQQSSRESGPLWRSWGWIC